METQEVGAELEKKLVFNILQYLTELTKRGNVGSDVNIDPEGMEVAVQCISAAFNLDVQNEKHQEMYSVAPLSLPQVFGLGLAGKQQLEAYAQSKMADQTTEPIVVETPASLPSRIPSELGPKFTSFVGLLEKKDFFKGLEPNSEEYRQRMRLAEEKFLARQAAESQPAPSPKAEPDPSALMEAEQAKVQGNDHLSGGRIKEAIACYDRAITLNPNSAVYFANRAAAHSQIGNHDKAIFDCKSAIDVDPKYSKAYSRLGFALFSLGKYREAIELGYKKCLELDPGNVAAKDALLLAQDKLDEQEGRKPKPAAPAPAVPFSGAPPMIPPPGLDQLLSNPELQGAVQNLAQQFPNLGGATGGGGAAAPPSFSDLMNNPQVMNMAQQFMSSPAFNQILSNPAFMNMAQSMMSNPGAVDSMFGGAAPGGGTPPGPTGPKEEGK